MKKFLIGVFVGVALTAGLGFSAVSYSVKEFLQNMQVNTTQMPAKGWVRWQTVIFDRRGCNWVDFTRINETPRVGWMPGWDFIQNVMIPTFGNPPLTEAEQSFCFGDWPSIDYVVAPNSTNTTRPRYDRDLWLATRDTTAQWKQTGRITIANSTCEPTVIRQTAYAYRYCRDAAGNAGLTVSVLKP